MTCLFTGLPFKSCFRLAQPWWDSKILNNPHLQFNSLFFALSSGILADLFAMAITPQLILASKLTRASTHKTENWEKKNRINKFLTLSRTCTRQEILQNFLNHHTHICSLISKKTFKIKKSSLKLYTSNQVLKLVQYNATTCICTKYSVSQKS